MNRNSKSRRVRDTQRNCTKNGRQFGDAARRASLAVAEMLESRTLLSVSASSLVGLAQTPGTQATYYVTDTSYSATNTVTTTVSGPVTAPTGQSAMKLDSHIVTHSGTTTTTSEDIDYDGMTSAGYVEFAEHYVSSSHTSDDAYVPPLVELPPTLSVGETYNSSYTDNWVVDSSSNGQSNHTRAITLDSASTQSVTVPAGTFDTYAVTVVDQTINGGTNTSHLSYAPGIGLVKWTSGDASGTTTWVLTSFTGVQDTLVFSTQPTDTGQGAMLSPVTVQLQNAGSVDANSNANVTLTLSGGNGTLSGTTTVAAVAGVATFSDLSIDKGGNYTLTASSSAATDTVASNKFKIVGDHLVFTHQPVDAGLNIAIPLVVTFENASNVVDTSAAGTVDLTLNTISGGRNAALGGTVSATLADGIAIFSSTAGPSINVSGSYTLTATQMQVDPTTSQPAPVDTTANTTSNQFDVGNDALKLKKAPAKAVNVDAPIPFAVEALDAHGKVDATFNDQAQITLNTIKGDSSATLGGTVLATFANGIATFDASDAPTIDAVGTYSLTITPVMPDEASGQLVPVTEARALTSGPIKVAGDHLVFVSPPRNADVNTAIPFKVALRDSKNKIDTEATSQLTVTLSGGANATLSGESTVDFRDGIAVFPGPSADDLTGVYIDTPGTYTFTVTEMVTDPDSGQPVASTTSAPIQSKPFKIAADKLVFTEQPTDTDVDSQLHFQITAENSHGKIDTRASGYVAVTLNVLSGGRNVTIKGTTSQPLVDGVTTFSVDLGDEITEPGEYTLTGTIIGPTSTKPGTSHQFKVKPLRLVFIDQPQDVNVNAPLAFKVELQHADGDLVTDETDHRVLLEDVNSARGGQVNYMVVSAPLIDGVATFNDSKNPSFDAAGKFTLTVAETDQSDIPVDYTSTAKSDKFEVLGFHLVFLNPPTTTPANQPITFRVELQNSRFEVVTTEDSNYIDVINITSPQGAKDYNASGKAAPIVGGIATFDANALNTIDTPGTYKLNVEEVSALGNTSGQDTIVPYTKGVTSGWFRVT